MIDLTTKFGQAVKTHLENEYVIWLTTVDSNLIPQPRPVWFLWENDSILIFSKPDAQKVKHIAKHSYVSVHFNTDETGDKHVMVLTGEAMIDTSCPPAKDVSAYLKKYKTGIADIHLTPESFSEEYSFAIRIKPANMRGWE
jgi:PPOX class probable F420-dependent enzyme